MKKYKLYRTLREDLESGKITCHQLVRNYLKNIEKRNAELNAFIEVFDKEAFKRADVIDHKIKIGKAGRLAGMVIGIKDVLCHKNHRSTGGSLSLKGFTSQFSATAIERLLREDAIIIGSQNCDEFGMGSSNENSYYGSCKNPYDIQKVAGGSSGGGASAVAADMCFASIGTDTGGSVRLPSSFCGVVGFKPTYSRISRWGLMAYASSFDCIGTMVHSVEDSALLAEVMAGKDEFDSTVSSKEVPLFDLSKVQESPFKIACLKPSFTANVQSEVQESLRECIRKLEELGHSVEIVEFDLLEYVLPTYYILTTAEVSSNMARYDGVRYGYRTSQKTKDIIDFYKKNRTESLGDETKNRILLGTLVLSADYHDAYYTKAQKVRRLLKNTTQELFKKFDFILSPTASTTAFRVGEKSQDPLQMYYTDLFTVLANLVGSPAISFPLGKDKDGMPIGIQLTVNDFEEQKLFYLSNQIHQLNEN